MKYLLGDDGEATFLLCCAVEPSAMIETLNISTEVPFAAPFGSSMTTDLQCTVILLSARQLLPLAVIAASRT